jgi:uncharacterized protein YdeI (BOF family)
MKKLLLVSSFLIVTVAVAFGFGQSPRRPPSELFPILKGSRWGYIDNKGKVVIEPKFEEARQFVDGLAIVRQDGRFGFIDKSGQIAVTIPFGSVNSVREFSDGLALVSVSEVGYRYIDKKGQVTLEPKVDSAGDFSEGLARVAQYDKWGFMDKTGQIVIEPIFDRVEDYSGGLARVQLGSRWGYIDKAGKWVWRLQP